MRVDGGVRRVGSILGATLMMLAVPSFRSTALAAPVRREVEAAGFLFDGESSTLANPADPHTVGVFDPSIRGRTDQFILRFRRPRSSE